MKSQQLSSAAACKTVSQHHVHLHQGGPGVVPCAPSKYTQRVIPIVSCVLVFCAFHLQTVPARIKTANVGSEVAIPA